MLNQTLPVNNNTITPEYFSHSIIRNILEDVIDPNDLQNNTSLPIESLDNAAEHVRLLLSRAMINNSLYGSPIPSSLISQARQRNMEVFHECIGLVSLF